MALQAYAFTCAQFSESITIHIMFNIHMLLMPTTDGLEIIQNQSLYGFQFLSRAELNPHSLAHKSAQK